jgi:hypothetical protein
MRSDTGPATQISLQTILDTHCLLSPLCTLETSSLTLPAGLGVFPGGDPEPYPQRLLCP